MKLVIQIRSQKYQPGVEDKIRKIVEQITKEEVSVKVVRKNTL